ncbi:MAG: Na+-transporting NADH:ubiquinone oxidoreductase subunit D [Ruminococcaceae bacterium]|nr:Na+-transporting NADH:ubiquinone oxidoreductase subunit D [Oscillospiraceae bacterium]
MDSKLHISVSPHIHSGISTQRIMLDVILALLPAAVAGCIIFGLSALAVIAVCIVAAVASEFVFNLIVKKEQTIGDLSAVVTGLLLALNLPANVPLWQAAVGSVFAIIIVKCIFGGIGCNLVNPAITARVFMLVAFGSMAKAAFPIDAVAGATPLVELAEGNMPSLMDLFLGKTGGAIGETCALALLIGGIYLLARRVITWHIPAAFIGSVFLLSFLIEGFDLTVALSLVLSGGLFIGAFFMATDYVTSPATAWGKIIFGVGAGLITVLIRSFGNYPEGVSFGILMMNILNPYIESWTPRKLFGGENI